MRVFSGIQPSTLHIGNYFGSLHQWIDLQNTHECLFCIVDLHALTSNYPNISDLSRRTAALYIACGIDPQKSTIFIQSHVPLHSQMFWLLISQTPLGWLNRMTQFKSNQTKAVSAGLLTYPVLMAADILLYATNIVPVGEDQKQHIEFTRDLAERINSLCATDLFVLPQPRIPQQSARIMSLCDGNQKMSKSDPNPKSCVFLTDSNDVIVKKIKQAKTDSLPFPTCAQDIEKRPEMHNLLSLLASSTQRPLEDVFTDVTSCATLKQRLADALIAVVDPIRTRFESIWNNDQEFLTQTLQKGAQQAKCTAEPIYQKVAQKLMSRTPQ